MFKSCTLEQKKNDAKRPKVPSKIAFIAYGILALGRKSSRERLVLPP
jgi:hypothetical protein